MVHPIDNMTLDDARERDEVNLIKIVHFCFSLFTRLALSTRAWKKRKTGG